MDPTEDDPKASERDESAESSSSSESEDGPDSSRQVEWLATGREKRSTAGNRMKSMLANEEPDSDLELLFAEDDNDAGFTDVDDGGSDVQMDSSSDDEDDQENVDELEGERELERQAKERRAAQRKRKAQEAIPVKFRKKVRIDQAATQAPRAKKKSERTSWLPTGADMPTRASERKTTRLSKEQLHLQMKEREAKRQKQLAIQEKKAKRLAETKKPAMTQAQRLREAAAVEKKNSKSLNRWEVAEKQREEERLAKLAALNNRQLEGPVITFWSGLGKKRSSAVEELEKKPRQPRLTKEEKKRLKEAALEKEKNLETVAGSDASTPVSATPVATVTESAQLTAPSGTPTPAATVLNTPQPTLTPTKQEDNPPGTAAPSTILPTLDAHSAEPDGLEAGEPPRAMAPPSSIPAPPASTEPGTLKPEEPEASPPQVMAPPSIPPPPLLPAASSVLAPPVLAPPLGAQLGAPGVALGFKSNVLAPPNTSHRPSPLSLPPSTPGSQPSTSRPPPPPPLTHLQPGQPKPVLKDGEQQSPQQVQGETEAAADESNAKSTRRAIILQNFDENAIKDKAVQTKILFGRNMGKVRGTLKPPPPPLCVITNHPAKYRDPKTGLPYYNSYAYREIQRLRRGDYKWSRLIGAWVGSGNFAAKGVPPRFLGSGEPERKETGNGQSGNSQSDSTGDA